MNVTGNFFKAAVECAMCNGTGKITEEQFGGKSVAEQSRVGRAGGDIWNQTQVRGSAEIRGQQTGHTAE